MPIDVVVGLPRPQTARKILLEACSLGVRSMHFVGADKGEPSYAQSTLWSSGEWNRILIAGAEQAFCTRLPQVTFGRPSEEILSSLPQGAAHIALDNYEASERLGALALDAPDITLAFGPERGWSQQERALLRSHGYRLAHLGTRVLRTETAVTAAVSLILAKLGRM
jgi:RsmE family RNA methyltransferase